MAKLNFGQKSWQKVDQFTTDFAPLPPNFVKALAVNSVAEWTSESFTEKKGSMQPDLLADWRMKIDMCLFTLFQFVYVHGQIRIIWKKESQH